MVTRNPRRRGTSARPVEAALAVLAAVLVSLLALSACGTAMAVGASGAGVDPGGPDIKVQAPPTGPTATTPPASPTHGPDRGTLAVVATVGTPDVRLDAIRLPTPAGLVALTTWVRVDRVLSGSAAVGQRLRILQIVRQHGVQMAGLPTPSGVLPALVSGRVYELWLRPFTVNDKAIAGTWMIVREREGVA